VEDSVPAQLRWLSVAEGGRMSLPSGPTFSTVAKFDRQGDDWLNEAWSLVATFVTLPQDGRHEVDVRFPAPDAPREWLTPGSRFWLMEGARAVAEGVVTSPGPASPKA
jgi:hypothetical protein